MVRKSIAYYYLNGGINVKPAARYMATMDEAGIACGGGGPTWNQQFIVELQLRGLKLSTVAPEPNEDLYPHGRPVFAPLPHREDVCTWPHGTLIVWDIS